MNAFQKKSLSILFEKPFFALINQAYQCHIKNFASNDIELCQLSNIKSGACPEDCAYCPQSGHYQTNVKSEKLLDEKFIIQQAKNAKAKGAKRFCMGAAWRSPPAKQFQQVLNTICSVKSLGLETCATLGMLTEQQAMQLKAAGLDYYNHNLDTSENFYGKIITTRTYQDRLSTLTSVANAGINICCGGILGLGESRDDRIELLLALASLPEIPKSIPINRLIPCKGTPLENQPLLDDFEFIRTIAVCRIMFPIARIRLSAGRAAMSETMQAWCFMAGANSVFIGDKLLTADNPALNHDLNLFKKLSLSCQHSTSHHCD